MRGAFPSRAPLKTPHAQYPVCSPFFTFRPFPPEFLRRRPVSGGDVFDLQIVATMQANGIQRIYTFNADDFEVFSELAVLTP